MIWTDYIFIRDVLAIYLLPVVCPPCLSLERASYGRARTCRKHHREPRFELFTTNETRKKRKIRQEKGKKKKTHILARGSCKANLVSYNIQVPRRQSLSSTQALVPLRKIHCWLLQKENNGRRRWWFEMKPYDWSVEFKRASDRERGCGLRWSLGFPPYRGCRPWNIIK